MKDYPELRLFPKESTDFLNLLKRPIVGLVTSWDNNLTEEDNLEVLRDIHRDENDFDRIFVYGRVPDDREVGLLLYSADQTHYSVLERRLADLCRQHKQIGFVQSGPSRAWFEEVQPNSIKLHQLKNPFAREVNRLDELAGYLFPAFRTGGYFPRDVTWVTSNLKRCGVTV